MTFLISCQDAEYKQTPKYCIQITLHVVDTVKEHNSSHSIHTTSDGLERSEVESRFEEGDVQSRWITEAGIRGVL